MTRHICTRTDVKIDGSKRKCNNFKRSHSNFSVIVNRHLCASTRCLRCSISTSGRENVRSGTVLQHLGELDFPDIACLGLQVMSEHEKISFSVGGLLVAMCFKMAE